MRKVGLWRLRMVEGPMADSPAGGPDGEAAAVKQVARSVPILGGLIDNLSGGAERSFKQTIFD